MNGEKEFIRVRPFEHIAVGAIFKGLEYGFVVVVNGKDDHYDVWVNVFDLPQYFSARPVRQVQVEKHDVRLGLGERFQGNYVRNLGEKSNFTAFQRNGAL